MQRLKKCVGCKRYNDGKSYCEIFCSINRAVLECPCKNCVVKVMCSSPCDDYIKLVNQASINWRVLEDRRRRNKRGLRRVFR